jgi:hypothetical protein
MTTIPLSRPFHRLFVEADPDADFLRVLVSPDEASSRTLTEIRCASIDELASRLKILGADSATRWLAEQPDGMPIFEAVPCTVDEVAASLKADPRNVTLIASDTSVEEMKRRVAQAIAFGET